MPIRRFGNLGLVFYASKRKKRAGSLDDGCVLNIKCPMRFSFTDLKRVTNDFSENNVIAIGGAYGMVYKAMLDHGQMVAIRRVKQGSLWDEARFTTEVELLSRLRHNNLLDLIGFCVHRGERMLVYNYIANGSLQDILFGDTGIRLDWGSRVRIALESARALAYLHNDANPRVIHRNIKPCNIFLDENLTAKVGYLGLAQILPGEPYEGDSHVSTETAGTLGYIDPEYVTTGQLRVKSDVYSFGIVLLQLIVPRPAFYLSDDVKETLESGGISGLKEELMDPLLRDSDLLVGFERFLSLALTCVQKLGSQRPSMRGVVKELESILDMEMEIDTETGDRHGDERLSSGQYSTEDYSDIDEDRYGIEITIEEDRTS